VGRYEETECHSCQEKPVIPSTILPGLVGSEDELEGSAAVEQQDHAEEWILSRRTGISSEDQVPEAILVWAEVDRLPGLSRSDAHSPQDR
jgi:hypothetical protein